MASSTLVASSRMAVEPARLGELADLLAERLPLSAPALSRLLVEQAFSPVPLAPADLTAAYEQTGNAAPFRLVRHRRALVVVPPQREAAASAVMTTATQFVRWWGLADVRSLIGRVRALHRDAADETFVRRMLAALPQLRWLDAGHGWFSLAGLTSRLGRVVRKVFGVLVEVAFADLLAALWKNHSPLGHPPATVMMRYLTEVADCDVVGDSVRPRSAPPFAALAAGEDLLVAVLRDAGGELAHADLRRTVERYLSTRQVRHIVDTSPLFVPVDLHRVRLIGWEAQSPAPISRSAITPR